MYNPFYPPPTGKIYIFFLEITVMEGYIKQFQIMLLAANITMYFIGVTKKGSSKFVVDSL